MSLYDQRRKQLDQKTKQVEEAQREWDSNMHKYASLIKEAERKLLNEPEGTVVVGAKNMLSLM